MNAPKVVFIGGGSYQWGWPILRDLFVTRELDGLRLTLMDLNRKALGDVSAAAAAIQQRAGSHWTVETTTSRRKALKGADYVIVCISTGAFDSMEHDLNVPRRYGVRHTVGDSVGPGGINRALRNVPVMAEMMQDINELCPEAWVLNLSNPMAAMTGALALLSDSGRVVGLCHEIHGGRGFLASLLGIDSQRADFSVTSVGLNHNIWLLGARLGGRCVMEEILRAVRDPDLAWRNFQKINPDRAAFDKLWQATGVKRLLAGLFGSLPLAGDRHTCENFGFLNPLPAVLESLGCKYTTIEERRERWLPPMKAKTQAIAAGTDQDYALKCSHEPVAPILAALHTGRPWRLEAGNLVNAGQISNLPRGAVVETPCLVSASGIEPVCVGDVPDPLAAFLTGHALRQKMVVEAALSADRSLALAALASDPLVTNAATCEAMLDELMDRTAQWLPQFYPEGRVPRRKRTAARGSSAPLADGADSLPAEISDRS